jgi:hypothetical protein
MDQDRPYCFAINTTNIFLPDRLLLFTGMVSRNKQPVFRYPARSPSAVYGAAVRRRNRMAESVPGTLGATYAPDLSKVERTFD